MVDKKLSEFSTVDKASVSDIVVLYNENSNTRNGRLPISTLDQFYDGIYLSKNDASSTYLTKTDASSIYLSKTDAGTTYLNKTDAGTTYLSKNDASSTYLSKTDAGTTYLAKNDATDTYLTKTDAGTTYLNKTDASTTYATKTEMNEKAVFNLFDHKWMDYELNDQSWLRADTFSWQDGTVYSDAYNHLVDDYTNHSIAQKYIHFYDLDWLRNPDKDIIGADHPYAWSSDSSTQYTDTEIPVAGPDGDKHYGSSDGTIGGEITSVGEVLYHTETIGSYTIQYYLTEDGHKIILPDQETIASNIYNQTGIAWYYILDEENQRFKLPRTKYGFVGFRDEVGKYVPESLPNITGEIIAIASNDTANYPATGAFKNFNPIARSGYNAWYGTAQSYNFDASRSSSAYQDNAPVQQRATQMYLYFYVGQFTQTATEQTAGLNSELFNGKADRDLGNLTINIDYVVDAQLPTADNNYQWYRKYKSGWVEQGGVTSVESTQISVTLPIEMASTNYSLTCGVSARIACSIYNTSTTQISLRTDSSNSYDVWWEVKGMAAQS